MNAIEEELWIEGASSVGRFPVLLTVGTGDDHAVSAASDRWPTIRATGPDFFESLIEIRRKLEPLGIVLRCHGSRINVFASAMQRQSAGGRRAYALTLPRTSVKPPVVDIFAPAPEDAEIVSVDDQLRWFERWASMPLRDS